eukprot:scaffold8228_cov79-Isochrysis_galbana.AAC.1
MREDKRPWKIKWKILVAWGRWCLRNREEMREDKRPWKILVAGGAMVRDDKEGKRIEDRAYRCIWGSVAMVRASWRQGGAEGKRKCRPTCDSVAEVRALCYSCRTELEQIRRKRNQAHIWRWHQACAFCCQRKVKKREKRIASGHTSADGKRRAKGPAKTLCSGATE